ncbi:hypothetical protein EMCG_04727 [[Emmonsia] crescens]|uniref:RING-type domain-containing protein n=1 Tax=[Emmonsia] crescens TaxID=73230 RepID=A0A0G2HR62_9EURO|nr:hypothetical protein EMCG_04727 [Emmonsia crescens UAMH 3008]
MAEVTPAPGAGAASSTTLPNTAPPSALPPTDVREGFDDNLVSMFHNNSGDEEGDDDDDDDDDDASNIETDTEKEPDVPLSIQDRLKLANTIVAQTPDSMQSVIGVKEPLTAAAYGGALARAWAAVNPEIFQSEADKEVGNRARENLSNTLKWASEQLPELHALWSADNVKVPVVEEPLDRYHRHAHILATSHMKVLYKACQEGHQADLTNAIKTKKYDGLLRETADALRALHTINNDIKNYNKTKKHPKTMGIIRSDRFFAIWSSSESTKLPFLCKTLRLPLGWSELPPVERYNYEEDAGMYWVPLWYELTPLLLRLWNGIVKGSPVPVVMPIHSEVMAKLKEVNSKIATLNSQKGQPVQLHEIQEDIIAQALTVLYSTVQNSQLDKFRIARDQIDTAFAELGYPEAWTPRATTECLICMKVIVNDATDYTQCQQCGVRVHKGCSSLWAQAYRDLSGKADFTCPHCRASTASFVEPTPQTATQAATETAKQNPPLKNTGKKRRIQIPPRKVSRCVRPGYTAYGQKISHINVYGNCAQVVVENENGSRELLTAMQAGGLAIVKAAENFPGIGRIESDGWKDLRARVSEMGEYGLLWVAIASHWDPMSDILPSVICCFFHHLDGVFTVKVGSRSNVAKILGKAGDLMVAEAICGSDDVSSVEEAVEIIYGVTHEEREEHWDSHPRPRRHRSPRKMKKEDKEEPVQISSS